MPWNAPQPLLGLPRLSFAPPFYRYCHRLTLVNRGRSESVRRSREPSRVEISASARFSPRRKVLALMNVAVKPPFAQRRLPGGRGSLFYSVVNAAADAASCVDPACGPTRGLGTPGPPARPGRGPGLHARRRPSWPPAPEPRAPGSFEAAGSGALECNAFLDTPMRLNDAASGENKAAEARLCRGS